MQRITFFAAESDFVLLDPSRRHFGFGAQKGLTSC